MMKRRIFLVVLAVMIAAAGGSMIPAAGVGAQSEKEKLNEKKKEKQAENERLAKESEQLKKEIEALDEKTKACSEQVDRLEEKLSLAKDKLSRTRQALAIVRESSKKQYAIMSRRIKFLYENGNTVYLEIIFEAKSFNEFMDRADYITRISNYDSTMYRKLKNTQKKMNATAKELEKDYLQVAALTNEAKTEQKQLETYTTQKTTRLTTYNRQIASNQQLISQYEAEIKKEEQEAAQAAQNSGAPEYDNSGSPSSAGFLWPCPASHRISSNFGYRIHPIFGKRKLHNGIDIPAPSGSRVLAAADGTVALAQYSSSAGNWIIINHGHGLSTVYMHNSSLKVSAGDHVKQGQVISRVGSTGNSTGPHLHFGVMKNGSYVNPRNYVK